MKNSKDKDLNQESFLGDLEKTIIINNLMTVEFHERDQRWRDDFLNNISGANLKLGNPEVVLSNDEFPYFQLQTVNTGESFQAFVIEKQIDALLEQGFGIVINAHLEKPDWVFSYGDIVNFKINREFYTDVSIFSVKSDKNRIGVDEDILVGQPSEDIFPHGLRMNIKEYLLHAGVKTPKIMLVARDYTDEEKVRQDLVFNMIPAQFATEKDFEAIMKALSWFLPKHYSFFGVDEMSIENGFQLL